MRGVKLGAKMRVGYAMALFALLLFCAVAVGPAPVTAGRWAYIDVIGAPGDGKEALERALGDQLNDRGFGVAGTPRAEGFEIQGLVRLFPAGRGEETIRIDWTVFGPDGLRLGNVTQTNLIPKGALNGRWGSMAEAAASAAAQDIMQYIAP
ncbi:MAG: hypothetical protein AAF405_00765 [Pseudomonadota bacterium]